MRTGQSIDPGREKYRNGKMSNEFRGTPPVISLMGRMAGGVYLKWLGQSLLLSFPLLASPKKRVVGDREGMSA